MKNIKLTKKLRSFIALAAVIAMLPLFSQFRSVNPSVSNASAPNSKFSGVQIGAITYSWRSMPGGVENIIKYCNETGINSIELMSNDV